jgi:hypothetical protein
VKEGDPGVDGRIILKCILKKQVVRSDLNSPGSGQGLSAGSCEHDMLPGGWGGAEHFYIREAYYWQKLREGWIYSMTTYNEGIDQCKLAIFWWRLAYRLSSFLRECSYKTVRMLTHFWYFLG